MSISPFSIPDLSPLYFTIPLTQGQYAIVDSDDYERLSAKIWSADRNKVGAYRASRRIGGTMRGGIVVLMHREVMGIGYGDPRIIDHINGNPLDNRKANLRFATKATNAHNVGVRRTNKSGYKGVSAYGRDGTWCAQIQAFGKYHFLGRFPTKELAAEAYAKAAKELHGEFARTS